MIRRLLKRTPLRQTELAALFGTVLLHLVSALLIVSLSSAKTTPPKSEEIKVPVALVSQQQAAPEPDTPKPDTAQPTFERKRVRRRRRRIPSMRKRRRTTEPPPKDPPSQVTKETIDCSMFDDDSCSPCLADAVTCKKCCGKKDTAGSATATPTNPSKTAGAAGVPCTGDMCPKKTPVPL